MSTAWQQYSSFDLLEKCNFSLCNAFKFYISNHLSAPEKGKLSLVELPFARSFLSWWKQFFFFFLLLFVGRWIELFMYLCYVICQLFDVYLVVFMLVLIEIFCLTLMDSGLPPQWLLMLRLPRPSSCLRSKWHWLSRATIIVVF